MKNFAYSLRGKLGNSWGLTLISSSIALYILFTLISAGVYMTADAASNTGVAALALGFGFIGGVLSVLSWVSFLGIPTGAIMLILERMRISDHLRSLQEQVDTEKTHQAKSYRTLIRSNIGLTLIIAAVLISAVSTIVVMSMFLLAASGSFDTLLDSDPLSGAETNSALYIIGLCILLLGAVGLFISGILSPTGSVVFIVEEVQKRKRFIAEIASYETRIASKHSADDVDEMQQPQQTSVNPSE